MQKAIIVYLCINDTYKPKNRPNAISDSLTELNEHLANGWSVTECTPMGTGSDFAACNLVILEKDEG